jgi:hypothetical protein
MAARYCYYGGNSLAAMAKEDLETHIYTVAAADEIHLVSARAKRTAG